jgi:hypothetical protein
MSLYLQSSKMGKLRSGKTTSSNSATNELSKPKSGSSTPSRSVSKCTVTLSNLKQRQKKIRAKEALQAHLRRMELGRSLCRIKVLPARQQLEELKVLQKNGHLDIALHWAKSERDDALTLLCKSIIDSRNRTIFEDAGPVSRNKPSEQPSALMEPHHNVTMMSVDLQEGSKPLPSSNPLFHQGTADDQKTIKVPMNPAARRRWSDASSISPLYVTATEDMLETSCVWDS